MAKPTPPPTLEAIVAELAAFGRVLGDDRALVPAWGQEKLVDQLEQHVRNRKSFVLVGPAGSGKSHVLHNLARRLRDASPPWLLLQTSTSEVMTDTKYIGEWETKLKNVVTHCLGDKRVVLYFTDINYVVTQGATVQRDASFASYLQPHLERGELVMAGETTHREMQLGLLRLPGFARMFTQFQVEPPTDEDTARILEKLVAEIERRGGHKLLLGDDVIESTIDLARSYSGGVEQPGRSVALFSHVLARKVEAARGEPVIEVGVDDVVAGLAAQTGLPERLLSDRKPLDPVEVRAFFDERVLGQDEAVSEMVDLITLIKAGLTDPKKPYAVLFFVGPTGVGKTEIAKTLAEYIFGSAERMIRVDMSEYMGADSVEKLIGSPWRPDTGATLVARVRAQPFSVILLDEVEKAHAQVFDLCLQMFDDGRLTDARGQTADFRRAIIVMTSNLASRISDASMGFGGGGDTVPSTELVLREVKRFFRPEFVNRLDKIVVYKPLTAEVMRKIVRRELGKVLLRSGIVRRRLVVDVDPGVVDLLCREGFSAAFGARPLKRRVADLVLVPLGREIVRLGADDRGSLLRVVVEDDRIAIRRVAPRSQRVAERLRLPSPEDERPRAVKPAELAKLLGELDKRLARLEQNAEQAGSAARKSKIVAATAEPTFWDDAARARELLADLVHLEALLEGLAVARRKLDDLREFAKAYARQPGLKGRFERAFAAFVAKLREVEHQSVAETPADRSDALVWVTRIGPARDVPDPLELLEKMYRSWADRRRFAVSVVSRTDGEAVWRIDGVSPFGLLKVEEGLHRFDGKDRKAPVMVRVEVLPLLDGDRRVARRDVKIDRASRGGRLEVVATHAPSGVAVEASVPGSELTDEAVLDWLEARVHRPARDLDRVVRRYGVEGKFAEDEATGERIGHRELAAGGLDELIRARLYM